MKASNRRRSAVAREGCARARRTVRAVADQRRGPAGGHARGRERVCRTGSGHTRPGGHDRDLCRPADVAQAPARRAEPVHQLHAAEREARAALAWIDDYGDRDKDGYVEYERRNEKTGLDNQCWKDSWDSIAFADGTLAPTPRATCELQGYVYDAKHRMVRVARDIWKDEALAQKLDREAEDLKERFNKDFWIPDRSFFALAFDGQKRKVDSLTSNIGHLLGSGIADLDKAVVERLRD